MTPYLKLAERARRRGAGMIDRSKRPSSIVRPKAEYRLNEIAEAPPSRLEQVGLPTELAWNRRATSHVRVTRNTMVNAERLSASALSHHGLCWVAFITNIAESDFRYAQVLVEIARAT